MRQAIRIRAAGRTSAFHARILLALFAIMAMCATPLGTGELLASESHVYERQSGDLREGDLPLRFALVQEAAVTAENLEEPDRSTLVSVLLDAPTSAVVRADQPLPGEVGIAATLDHALPVRHPAAASFEARAPPLA